MYTCPQSSIRTIFHERIIVAVWPFQHIEQFQYISINLKTHFFLRSQLQRTTVVMATITIEDLVKNNLTGFNN